MEPPNSQPRGGRRAFSIGLLICFAAGAVWWGARLPTRLFFSQAQTQTFDEIEPHVAAFQDEVALCAMEVLAKKGDAEPAGEGGAKSIIVRRYRAGQTEPFRTERLTGPDRRRSADPTLAYGKDGTLYLTWLLFRAEDQHGSEPFDMGIAVAKAPRAQPFSAPFLVASAKLGEYDKPWTSIGADGSLHIVFRSSDRLVAGLSLVTLSESGVRHERTVLSEAGFTGALPTVCSDASSDTNFVAYVRPERGIEGFFFDASRVDPVLLLSEKGDRVAMEGPSCVVWGHRADVLFGDSPLPWDTRMSPLLEKLVVVEAERGNGVLRRRMFQEKGTQFLHPMLAQLGLPAPNGQHGGPGNSGGLRIASLSVPQDKTRSGALVLLGFPWDLSAQEPPTKATLVEKLPLSAERDSLLWPGDYLGLCQAGDRMAVGYIEAEKQRTARLLRK